MHMLSPPELKTLMDTQKAILFDIRGEDEFAREHIPGAVLLPGDQIDSSLRGAIGDREAVFYCTSGMRTRAAAPVIEEAGIKKSSVLSGGLNAWRDNGLPVVSKAGRGTTISLARQVQLTVGLLTLLLSAGILAGPAQLAYVTMAIGAGLAFAGLTGTCALAHLLMLMPWNRTVDR
ncbi:MAG: rhodanese-like domain-containing protein [Rhodospirillales bacterium]